MSNACPHCGGEMLDDGPLTDGEEGLWVYRCVDCPYYVEARKQPDGTIVAVGHEEGEG